MINALYRSQKFPQLVREIPGLNLTAGTQAPSLSAVKRLAQNVEPRWHSVQLFDKAYDLRAALCTAF